MTTVTAQSAASFDASIGINVHANYYDTSYGNTAAWVAAVLQGGFESVRMGWTTDPGLIAATEQLAADGVKVEWVVDPRNVTADAAAASIASNPALAHAIWAVEGPNEPDVSGDPNWAADTVSYITELSNDIRSNPVTASIQVIAPSIAETGDSAAFQALGNLDSVVNYANLHPYPGNLGAPDQWLQGVIASDAAIEAPGKPIVVSETGFSTEQPAGADAPAGNPPVSDAMQAILIPQLYFEDFASGIPITNVYELLDEQGDGTYQDSFGLMTSTLTPKPSYLAVQAITTLLKDPNGANFHPGSLSYSLTGTDASTNSVLLEKSDGTFWLAVWEQNESTTGVPVTLTLATAESGAIYVPNTSGTTAVSTFNGTTTINFNASADVTLVEIGTPASGAGSATGALTPSPDDTTVAGATGEIVTAAHNVFAIDAGGQITENGSALADTAYVTELAYVGGTLYQENVAGLWWSFSETTNAWTSVADPLTTSSTSTSGSSSATADTVASDPPTPSANDTLVHGTTGDIVTAAHNVFAIDASGQITENGSALADTAYVTELAYVGGTLYQENVADLWWSFNETTNAWTSVADPLTTTSTSTSGSSSSTGDTVASDPPAPTPSANDTLVQGTTGDIVTAAHNVFAINAAGQITENGNALASTAYVTELAYFDGTLYQENVADLWWSFNETTNAWTSVSDPLPATASAAPAPSGPVTLDTFNDSAGHEVFAVETTGSTPATISNFTDSDLLDLVPVTKAATAAGGHPAVSYVSDGHGGTLVELSTTGNAADAHPVVDLQHILPTDAQAHTWA